MCSATNWHDHYTFEKDRIIYVDEQLRIPGVHALAYQSLKNTVTAQIWHFHENSFEFTVAVKGVFTYYTPSFSEKFSGNDVYIAYPNEVHGTNEHPVSLGELYWFQLDISNENEFLFMDAKAAGRLISKLKSIHGHVIRSADAELPKLLKKAFQQAHNQKSPHLVAAYLQLFLQLIVDASCVKSQIISQDIQSAIKYIDDNIDFNISLDELALRINLSTSRFKQKFSKEVGISPRNYINEKKVEQAKLLLAQGMSVTDVSMQLNFGSTTYFSTVFKKYTMYAPREYIKHLKEDNPTE